MPWACLPRSVAVLACFLALAAAVFSPSSVAPGGTDRGSRRLLLRKEEPDVVANEDTAVDDIIAADIVVVEVTLGSSASPEKCVQASEYVACPPDSGNPEHRINGILSWNEWEEFDVTVSGSRTVCAKRKDRATGWTINLRIWCHRQDVQTVDLGMSQFPTKCVSVPRAVACTWNAANYGVRAHGPQDTPDGSFLVSVLRGTNRVCVTRLDLPNAVTAADEATGWDFPIRFACADLDWSYSYQGVALDIEVSPAMVSMGYHCQTLHKKSDLVTCPTNFEDEAAQRVEVVTHRAFQETSLAAVRQDLRKPSGTTVCIRKLNVEEPWVHSLHLKCNGASKVDIGDSVMSTFKCVTLDTPVECLIGAADMGFRLNTLPAHMKQEEKFTFDVTTSGTQVCVRRTDRDDSGWQQDLVIACAPRVGLQADAVGDSGTHLAIGGKDNDRRRRAEPQVARRQEHVEGLGRFDPMTERALKNGNVVSFDHIAQGWFGCAALEDCTASRVQAPDRFVVFVHKRKFGSPLKSGDVTYIMAERNGLWLRCETRCTLEHSTCNSTGTANDDNCRAERFRIWSSQSVPDQDFIHDGQTIWLERDVKPTAHGSESRLLKCDKPVKGGTAQACSARGDCGVGAVQRTVLKGADPACTSEMFRVFGAKRSGKGEAVIVAIGEEPKLPVKCVDIPHAELICAINAGDPTLRVAAGNYTEEDEGATFEITMKGKERVDNGGKRLSNQVCARRLDRQGGWEFDLRITCDEVAHVPAWPHDVPSLFEDKSSRGWEQGLAPLEPWQKKLRASVAYPGNLLVSAAPKRPPDQAEFRRAFRLQATQRAPGAAQPAVAPVAPAVVHAAPPPAAKRGVGASAAESGNVSQREVAQIGNTSARAASAPNLMFGNRSCRCIAIDKVDGITNVNLKGIELTYPASMGAHCESWDSGNIPGICDGGEEENPWCKKAWCYVDPCECDIAIPPSKTWYFANASYHGRPLFFSHTTCAIHEKWNETVPEETCTHQQSEGACTSLENCAWSGTKCLGLDAAAACKSIPDFHSAGNASCPCVGIHGKTGRLTASILGHNVTYPGDLGGSCEGWDLGRYPGACDGANSANGSDPSGWCSQRWCYVDPCDCEIDTEPMPSTYFPAATHSGTRLHYSYATCGSVDMWTADFGNACVKQATEGACKADGNCTWTGKSCLGAGTAVNCEGENVRVVHVPEPGSPLCPCIGFEGEGHFQGIADNMSVRYPLTTGSSCKSWHEDVHPRCQKGADPRAGNKFCEQKWCFVDSCHCKLPLAYRRSKVIMGGYQGKPLAYSYTTCGSEDHYGEYNAVEGPALQAEVGSSSFAGARTRGDEIECDSEVTSAIGRPGVVIAGEKTKVEPPLEGASFGQLGMFNCPCIGLDIPGVLELVVGLARVKVSATLGSSCASLEHPTLCTGVGPRPDWCTGKWCFVDPCKCSLLVPPKPALMAPNLTFGPDKRPAFYSAATCNARNQTYWGKEALSNHSSCLRHGTVAACTAEEKQKCSWVQAVAGLGVCIESDRAAHCSLSETIDMALPAVAAATDVGTEKASCSREICAFGFELSDAAFKHNVLCAQTPCAFSDTPACCAPAQSCTSFGDCTRGFFKTKEEHAFCRGEKCDEVRDVKYCCVERATCSEYAWQCSAGKLKVKPGNSLDTTVFCQNSTCHEHVDRDTCCDFNYEEQFSQTVFIHGAIGIFAALVAILLICLASRTRRSWNANRELRTDSETNEPVTFAEYQDLYRAKNTIGELSAIWDTMPPAGMQASEWDHHEVEAENVEQDVLEDIFEVPEAFRDMPADPDAFKAKPLVFKEKSPDDAVLALAAASDPSRGADAPRHSPHDPPIPTRANAL